MAVDKLIPHQWKSRVIIISESNSAAQKHFEAISQAQPQEWAERKLRLVSLGKTDYEKASQGNAKAYAGLVGLDGGLKKIYIEPPKAEEIFQVIDSMPMRKSEMENK